MDSLIKRLQDAESGSRELDALIALAIGGYSMWKSKHGYWNIDGPDGERLTCEGRDPGLVFDPATGARLAEESPPMSWIYGAKFGEVTTSLDAIVALIGEKLPLPITWGVQQFANGKYEAHIESHEGKFLISGDMEIYDIAPTPALALCVVLLQALQSQEPTP